MKVMGSLDAVVSAAITSSSASERQTELEEEDDMGEEEEIWHFDNFLSSSAEFFSFSFLFCSVRSLSLA